LLGEFQFIKIMWNSTHAVPWSHHYDERDNVLTDLPKLSFVNKKFVEWLKNKF
jgi:hypothetical protein